MFKYLTTFVFVVCTLGTSEGYAKQQTATSVVESAREIPLVYDVDVIVIGGSTRGVAAAVAAAETGAKVFLAAERPYLGEDMCATYRLWLEDGEKPESDLAKAIFVHAPGEEDEVAGDPVVRMPTPMIVKRALDTALLNAGVQFLYGSYMADVLLDENQRMAGVTIVNRSGRQAVRGRVIIDATERATAARICGAQFEAYPEGAQTFSRVVIGGKLGPNGKALGRETVIADRTLPMYEYTVKVRMQDGSWASFAKADQKTRDMIWDPSHVTSAEWMFQVSPDPLKAKATQPGAWKGVAQVDPDALRPQGPDGLYVLGGCAAVSREAAAALMRPLSGMQLGARIGQLAAREAKSLPTAGKSVRVAGALHQNSRKAEVGEMLQGIRSMAPLSGNPTIPNQQRSIPILGRYDTVVVGGGTGGAPAGIGASRAGARTLIVEYLYGLGGVGTIGRIAKYYHGNRVGFTKEVDAGVASYESDGRKRRGWNIEHKMEWLRSEYLKAGGELWFRSLAVGSLMDGDRCIGVVVATPYGRGAVLANTVIDATGNAVIPACAGMETQAIGGDHISVQGTGLPQQTPGDSYWNSDWTFVDDDDVLDMWRTMVVAKAMGGKSGYPAAFDLGQLIDSRARRRIVGDIVISPMDIVNQRTYPDIITVSKSNFDNHGFSSHPIFMVTPPDRKGLVGNVPYRALLPKGKDGILVTGLGMSAHGDAMPVMRMQPDVQNQGYAAGKASAMAAEKGTTVRNIDIKALQRHLVEVGIIPEELLSAKDSYPPSPAELQAAAEKVGKDYSGIALVLVDVPKALPMLRTAYHEAADPAVKLRYAHVLGMLYDDTGVQSLIRAVKDAKWDKGWNFRGMGQYGATTSYVDNLVIALGRTGSKQGLPAVLEKLDTLTPESEFSHYRAVSMALETLEDPQAAAPLATLLQKPEISGHAFLEIDDVVDRTPGSRVDTSTRNASLKELILARTLYRCGDHQGIAKKILMQYARDYRGHYSRHAKAILSEGS